MKKRLVLPVLAALEAIALGLGGLFWFRMRRELLAAYGIEPLRRSWPPFWIPRATRLALSAWFAPSMALGGAACVVAGLVLGGNMRTRMSLAGAGLVVTAFGVAFAMVASYAPLFVNSGPDY